MLQKQYFLKLQLTFLIFAFGLFVLFLRYPFNPHEIGMDGFLYHEMTTILNRNCYAPWLLHPLSYWGFYPFSDSSAGPFITGIISKTLNISIESSILILSSFFSMFLFIIPLLIGLKYKRHIFSAVFLGIITSIAPIIFFSTQWELSERAGLVCFFSFILLIIMMIFEDKQNINNRLYGILFVSYIISTTIHKISFFILPIIIIFLIFRMINKNNKLEGYIASKSKKILFWSISIIISISIMIILSNYFNIGFFNFSNYSMGAIFNTNNVLGQFINLGITTIGGSGILVLIFGVLGFFSLIIDKIQKYKNSFFLISFIALFPFIPIRTYMRPLIPVLLEIFIFIGFIYTFEHIKSIKKYFPIFFITSILIATSFSLGMNKYWNSQREGLAVATPSEDIINLAAYIKQTDQYEQFSFSSTNGMTGLRIEAFTDIPFSPEPNSALWYGFINKSKINIRSSTSINDLSFYTSDTIFQIQTDWYKLYQNSINSSIVKNIILKYRIRYIVEDNAFPGKTSGYPIIQPFDSNLLESINNNNYVIYRDNSNSFIFISV